MGGRSLQCTVSTVIPDLFEVIPLVLAVSGHAPTEDNQLGVISLVRSSFVLCTTEMQIRRYCPIVLITYLERPVNTLRSLDDKKVMIKERSVCVDCACKDNYLLRMFSLPTDQVRSVVGVESGWVAAFAV